MLRSFAIIDTYKKFEEEATDYFFNRDWKAEISGEFEEVLKEYIPEHSLIGWAVEELAIIVGGY